MKAILEGGSLPASLPIKPSAHSKHIARILCNVSFWKLITLMQWPVSRALATVLLVGKPVQQLYRECMAVLRRLRGWLLAPVRYQQLRRLSTGWFRLRNWHVMLATAAAGTVLHRIFQTLRGWTDPRLRLIRSWRAQQAAAPTYESWKAAQIRIDELEGVDRMQQWRHDTRLYDRRLLQKRLQHLRDVLSRGDIGEILFAVRADLLRNLGNITNSELHETNPLVPEPILAYIKEVQAALHFITEYNGTDFRPEEKINFLRETRHAFGRTGLVLSGGGGLGAFHLGVAKALLDHKVLPRVLSGSSAGSIVCAILGTYKDEELRQMFDQLSEFEMSFFSSSTATEFFRHLLFKGTLHDHEVLTARLRKLYGDLTFLEAYVRTGRILNVVVTAADTNEPPRLLNYLTAPHVLIWSAVSCSSAFPYLFAAQDLWARNHKGDIVKYNAETMMDSQRRWRDGSLEEDLPMRGLAEQFNVNYYIVSQTNPHIVPLLSFKERLPRLLYNLIETEFKHRCTQAMELIPSRSVRYLCKLFNQPWEGDITMMLPNSYNEVRRAIMNPSKEDLADVAHQGQLATFAKLSAVECNCAIEMTLDECMARVASELMGRSKGQRAKRVHPRIPSWLNLKSLGLPSVSSQESLAGGPSSNGLAAYVTDLVQGAHGAAQADARAMSRAPSLTRRYLQHTIDEDEAIEHDATQLEGEDYAAAEYSGVPAPYDSIEYPGWEPFDCCDRSTNVWETLLPLVSAAGNQGLDCIAP